MAEVVGTRLKDGTIRLLLDGIIAVRNKHDSVVSIAKEYGISRARIYVYFRKFSQDTGYPYSSLLYQPHTKRGFIPVVKKKRHYKRGNKPAMHKRFFISYDYHNFNISMVEDYLNSSNPEDYVEGATLLIETISKIMEVCE